MALLTAKDRRTAKGIAGLGYCNPFLPERVEMERTALGADFVLLGRAFMSGVAALGDAGGEHVVEILTADLKNNMTQLGCSTLAELSDRLDA